MKLLRKYKKFVIIILGDKVKRVKNNTVQIILNLIIISIGCMIAALAIECFLIPNTILDGGITGISIIIHKVFKIPLSLLVIILNVPFVYIGYKNLGKHFVIRTVYSMIVFSVFLDYFKNIQSFTNEMLLATVFGGGLLGIGVGLVIRFGGCVDGTESVAIVMSKKFNFSVGQIVLIFNLIVFTIAGFIFGFDRAMYSLLTYIITFKVIDFVAEGIDEAKAAMIITDKGTKLSDEIYNRLGRTTTTLRGKGLISGEKAVLYCVLTRMELFELKRIVEEMDESAFVTINDISDIIGNHIKSTKNKKTT